MPTTVKVPSDFVPLFDQAEVYVKKLFDSFKHSPEEGAIHIGGRRYVLIRGESLFVALFDQLQSAFGQEQAYEFIYNMARIIGKSDSECFSTERNITEPNARLSTGPVHFAFAGWATVELFPDCRPTPDANYYLHYQHPNTFESEVFKQKKRQASGPVCVFSAGYSAGWCSYAYGLEVHAREVTCTACGDAQCEFVMAPYEKLDAYIKSLKK